MKLINMKHGNWVAVVDGVVAMGPLEYVRSAIEVAPYKVSPRSIRIAVEVMKRFGHNVAEIEPAGHYIYTEGEEAIAQVEQAKAMEECA